MEKVIPHTHNRTDSPSIPSSSIDWPLPTALTDPTQTATATYGTNEQSMLNALKAEIVALHAILNSLGITK